MISGEALIVTAAFLGLSGGLTPGPLLTLVVSETLKYGIKAGIKVSLVPLLTDTPIILAVLWLFSRISGIDPLIGLLSLLGGVFLLFIGYESIRFHGLGIEEPHKQPKSLRKGIVVNFLNPNPYLFFGIHKMFR